MGGLGYQAIPPAWLIVGLWLMPGDADEQAHTVEDEPGCQVSQPTWLIVGLWAIFGHIDE